MHVSSFGSDGSQCKKKEPNLHLGRSAGTDHCTDPVADSAAAGFQQAATVCIHLPLKSAFVVSWHRRLTPSSSGELIKCLYHLTEKPSNMADLEVKEKKKSKDKSGDGSSSAKVEKKEKKEKDSSKTEGGEKAEKKEKKEKKEKDPDAAAAPKEKSDKSDREKEKKDKSDKSERSVKSDKSEKPSKDKKSSRDDSVADTGRPGAPPPPTARAPPVKSTLPVKKTNYLAGLDLPSEGVCEFRQPSWTDISIGVEQLGGSGIIDQSHQLSCSHSIPSHNSATGHTFSADELSLSAVCVS